MDGWILINIIMAVTFWLLSAIAVHFYKLSEQYAPSYSRLRSCEEFIKGLINEIRNRPNNQNFDEMLSQVANYRSHSDYFRMREIRDAINYMDFSPGTQVTDATIFTLEFKPLEVRLRNGGVIRGWQRNGVGIFNMKDLESF